MNSQSLQAFWFVFIKQQPIFFMIHLKKMLQRHLLVNSWRLSKFVIFVIVSCCIMSFPLPIVFATFFPRVFLCWHLFCQCFCCSYHWWIHCSSVDKGEVYGWPHPHLNDKWDSFTCVTFLHLSNCLLFQYLGSSIHVKCN